MVQFDKETRRFQQISNALDGLKILETQAEALQKDVDELQKRAAEKGGNDFWANHHLMEAHQVLHYKLKEVEEAKKNVISAQALPEEIDDIMSRMSI